MRQGGNRGPCRLFQGGHNRGPCTAAPDGTPQRSQFQLDASGVWLYTKQSEWMPSLDSHQEQAGPEPTLGFTASHALWLAAPVVPHVGGGGGGGGGLIPFSKMAPGACGSVERENSSSMGGCGF